MTEVIRAATITDVDGIVAILVELAHEDGHPSPDVRQVTAVIRACVDSPARTIYVCDSAVVAGYIAVHWIPFPRLGGYEGYISDLAIRTSERGKGIGSRLLSVVEGRALELGCSRLILNNRISSKSYARGFYKGRGFRQRDEFANLVKVLR